VEIFESLLARLRIACVGFTDARRSPDADLDSSILKKVVFQIAVYDIGGAIGARTN